MGSENERFERAVDEAYRRQLGSSPTSRPELTAAIIRRGRRRLAARTAGAIGLVAVLTTGGLAAFGSIPAMPDKMDPADAPVLGAEKVVELGGPMAGHGDELFVANGKVTNGPGDKASIASLDVTTTRVSDTPPLSAADPLNVAAGPGGLWLVTWSGDMPPGGAGSDVKGNIQLVDPRSGEVLHDLPRPDSAPYDVAVDAKFPEAGAWVVDAARDELIGLDARSGAIGKVIELDRHPNTVASGEDAVWVGANPDKNGSGALYRWGADGELDTFPVDHCLNDLYVLNDAVWAVDYCGGAVHGFDAGSGEEFASVEVGDAPTALTFADGLLWVTRGAEVVRVDPNRAEVVGDPIFVAEGSEHIAAVNDVVYVSTWEGVFRLGEDAPIQAPRPTQEEEEPPPGGTSANGCDTDGITCIPLDRPVSEVATGFGSAWVGNIGEGKTFGIARFDSDSGAETARLGTNGFTMAMAADEQHMWALLDQGEDSVLQRIDPATTEVVDSYEIGPAGNVGEPSLAVAAGYVWVSGPEGAVTRISTGNGEMNTTSYSDRLPGYGADNGPLYLAYGDERLWLSYGSGDLGVVNPATDDLVRVDMGALEINAYEITVAAGQVWSPHQNPRGDNIVSYASTSGGGPDGQVELPPGNPVRIAPEGDRLWVLQDTFDEDQSEPGWVIEVDPNAHETVGDPLSLDLGFRGDLAVGEGYVWVTGNQVLYRIEPDRS